MNPRSGSSCTTWVGLANHDQRLRLATSFAFPVPQGQRGKAWHIPILKTSKSRPGSLGQAAIVGESRGESTDAALGLLSVTLLPFSKVEGPALLSSVMRPPGNCPAWQRPSSLLPQGSCSGQKSLDCTDKVIKTEPMAPSSPWSCI